MRVKYKSNRIYVKAAISAYVYHYDGYSELMITIFNGYNKENCILSFELHYKNDANALLDELFTNGFVDLSGYECKEL